MLPAKVMVAGGRLESLLEQAVDAQLARCMFHNNHRVAVSLLSDYVAGAEQIPTTTVQVGSAPPPPLGMLSWTPVAAVAATALGAPQCLAGTVIRMLLTV